MKAAIDYSDALILGSKDISSEVMDYLDKSGKTFLEYQETDKINDAYSEFYDKVLAEEIVTSW